MILLKEKIEVVSNTSGANVKAEGEDEAALLAKLKAAQESAKPKPAATAPAPATPAPAAPAPAPAAPAPTASTAEKGSLGKIVKNYIICNDPQLIPLEQQYLRYVGPYKQVIVDGKYGISTNVAMQFFLGVQNDKNSNFFNEKGEIQAKPDVVCGYIKNDLPKKAGVVDFEALKKLVQSKLPPGQKAGVVPAPAFCQSNDIKELQKLGNLFAYNITSDKKSYVKYAENGIIKSFTPGKDQAFQRFAFMSDNQGLKDLVPNKCDLNKFKILLKKLQEKQKAGVKELQPNASAAAAQTAPVPEAPAAEVPAAASQTPEGNIVQESWSTKNKNKYTQNLFERLIKDVSKGK